MNKKKRPLQVIMFYMILVTIGSCRHESTKIQTNQVSGKQVDLNAIQRYSDSLLVIEAGRFADSVCQYLEIGLVPSFLFDDSLESRHQDYASISHYPRSFRKLILDNVDCENELTALLNTAFKNRESATLPSDSTIPFGRYTFPQLIQLRISEIRQKNNFPYFYSR